MIWQFLKGVRPAPKEGTAIVNGNALKFDYVNDHVSVGNNNFYNAGLADYTVVAKVFLLSKGIAEGINKNHVIFYKAVPDTPKGFGLAVIPYDVRSIGTAGVKSPGQVHFSHRYAGVNVTTYAVLPTPVKFGEWVRVCIRRKGVEFSVRNIDTGEEDVRIEAVNPDQSNIAPMTFGTIYNTLQYTMKGYIGSIGYYDSYLENDELEIYKAGIFPSRSAKYLSEFESTFGNQAIDRSSVANNGVLVNFNNVDMGIPDPSTNRVWVPEHGIEYFDAPGIKTFTAYKDLSISRIARGYNTTMKGIASHKRGGVLQASYELKFPNNNIQSALNIAMLKDDTLELEITEITGDGTLELFH